MISIGDNLGYKGIKPNFVRDSFDTISLMSAVNDNIIDDGHLSYCVETDKHYKFNRTNSIDSTTGKWRQFLSDELGQSSTIGVTQKVVTNNFLTINTNLALKQDKLTTGSGIQISDQNVISATVSSYTYAGTVSTVSELPITSTIGYFYCVTNDTIANTNYAWNGNEWQSIGNSLYALATETKSGLMPYHDKQKINLIQTVDDNQFSIVDSNGNIGLKFDSTGFDVNKLGSNIQNLIKQIDNLSLVLGTTTGTAFEGSAGLSLQNSVTTLQNNALQLGETSTTAYSGDKGKQNTINIAKISSLITSLSVMVASINSIICQVNETGFNITDATGNVSMKYDVNGLDVALLSTHFVSLIKAIDGIGLILGETSITAYPGDKGKKNASDIVSLSSTVSSISRVLTTISSIIQQTVNSGFVICDTSGNVGIKYDSNGFDTTSLSTHFKNLIKAIEGIGSTVSSSNIINAISSMLIQTSENGYYVTDVNENVGMKYDSSGFDVALISSHFRSLLANYFTSKTEFNLLNLNTSDGLLSIYHQREVKLCLPSTAKVILYGDSISSTDYTWYKERMQYYTGLTDVNNNGLSGRTTAYLASNSALSNILNYQPDLIIIQVGGNDVGDVVGTFGAVPTETTVTETDITIDYNGTYWIQAVSHIIRKVKAYYYNIVTRAALTGSETAAEKIAKINAVKKPHIAVLTPTPQKRSGGNLTWSNEQNWIRKRNAVVECCNKYNVQCIDIYSDWGVDMSLEPEWSSPTDQVNQNGIYTMDGLHPSQAGYERIVQLITGKINITIKS